VQDTHTMLSKLKYELKQIANPEKATILQKFFKTGKGNQFIKISQIAQTGRSLSTYSFSHLLRGKADTNIDAKGNIWDFAAPAICVEEAGGKFSDFEGKFSLTSDNGLFSNGLLHNQVLKILE